MSSQPTVVVTGAARGFGAELAAAFAQSGWFVVGIIRPQVQGLPADVTWVEWDVTQRDTSALNAALGDRPVDLLVNNAGSGMPGGPLADIDVDDMLSVLDVNVGGVMRTTQTLLPNLLRAPRPTVVNVSSRLASLQDQADGKYAELRTSYAYRVSKAAQNMVTICMAAEFGPQLQVFALHPGELATSMGQATARTSPRQAADDLVALVVTGQVPSPAFVRPTGEPIRW